MYASDVNNNPDSYSTVAFRSWLPILLLTNFKCSQYYYILQIVQGGKVAWFSQIDLQPQMFSSEIIGMATHTTMEPWMFSSELQLSSTTVKLFHLEQFAIYGIYTYIIHYIHAHKAKFITLLTTKLKFLITLSPTLSIYNLYVYE